VSRKPYRHRLEGDSYVKLLNVEEKMI